MKKTLPSPMSDTIIDIMVERGWGKGDCIADLAQRTGFTKEVAHDLIRDFAHVTPAVAQRLSEVLGSTPEFWLRRAEQAGLRA